MVRTTDQEAFRRAVAALPGFVYRNGFRLALLSLGWVVASLPLVTIGPATLAAYAAVQDLRSDRNRIDRDRLQTVLRRNGVASALLAGVPATFGAIAVLYGTTALARGSLAGELVALVAAYIAVYAVLTLMPIFTALARGEEPLDALRYGVDWLSAHPTPALATALLTLVVLAVSVLLTIGFVLLFAGVAFSLQIAVVETVEERTGDAVPAGIVTTP